MSSDVPTEIRNHRWSRPVMAWFWIAVALMILLLVLFGFYDETPLPGLYVMLAAGFVGVLMGWIFAILFRREMRAFQPMHAIIFYGMLAKQMLINAVAFSFIIILSYLLTAGRVFPLFSYLLYIDAAAITISILLSIQGKRIADD